LRQQLLERPELGQVVAVASFLVDGVRGDDATTIAPGAVVDVLPPFAGG
jgi:molybdopterin synthase sulfur carrier subunit